MSNTLMYCLEGVQSLALLIGRDLPSLPRMQGTR